MPTLDEWVARPYPGKEQTLITYIDDLIIGLIRRVGLRVDVKRTPTRTTLTIHLKRAE